MGRWALRSLGSACSTSICLSRYQMPQMEEQISDEGQKEEEIKSKERNTDFEGLSQPAGVTTLSLLLTGTQSV